MALYPVVRYPNPVLLKATVAVHKIGERERILVRDMIETMYAEKGVGLAANQIGISRRIFVASPDGEKGNEIALFNPEIVRRSGAVNAEEGCLSVPGLYEKVKRYERVTVRGTSPEGKTVEMDADGLLARIFQHETDHLNGLLFIHRLGLLKKQKVFRHLHSSARAADRAGPPF